MYCITELKKVLNHGIMCRTIVPVYKESAAAAQSLRLNPVVLLLYMCCINLEKETLEFVVSNFVLQW